MVNRYGQGRAFEYKVIDALKERGFITVRAAGSAGAGKVDVIGVRPGTGWHPGEPIACTCHADHLWIQCKRDGKIGPAEWNTLYETAGWVGATAILASNGPRGRGVTWERIIGSKVPYSRGRPAEPYVFRDPAEGGSVTG